MKHLLDYLKKKICSHKKLEKLYSSGYDMGFGCPECYKVWTFPKGKEKGTSKLNFEVLDLLGFTKITDCFK